MSKLNNVLKSLSIAYLIKEFDKDIEETHALNDIFDITDCKYDPSLADKTSLYFANGEFTTAPCNTEHIKKLTINEAYAKYYTCKFVTIFLTVYVNHHIAQIDNILCKLSIYEDLHGASFNVYRETSIPCIDIDEQKAIVKMYNLIINADSDFI